jgi:hypothetical protein
MRGQNTARPVTSNSAGRKVAWASSAATMLQGVRLRGQQADHGADNRAGGGQQGRQRAAQRDGHGIRGGGVKAQFFPIPVGQQQRVVRGRAEDQYSQDRGGQRAHGEPGVEQAVHRGFGDDDTAQGTEQGQQPQQGAAVDEDEDDRDDHHRGEQQRVFGFAGDAAVGGQRGRSGHGYLQAARRAPGRPGNRLTDRLDRGGVSAVLALAVGPRGDIGSELIGPPVGRPLRGAGEPESFDLAGQACHGHTGRGHRRQISGRQPLAAGEHHGRRVDIGLARSLLELDDPGRGRRGRQIGGGGAIGQAGQGMRQRVEGHRGKYPDDHHRPAQPPQAPAEPAGRRRLPSVAAGAGRGPASAGTALAGQFGTSQVERHVPS